MKFHQLPIGARFRLRGTVMRKTAPLRAAAESDGSEKLIARSAVVERLGNDDAVLPELPAQIDGGLVEAALRQLVKDCCNAAAGVAPSLVPQQRDQLDAIVEAAAQQALKRLSGDG
jgi:hypothetical protein